MEEKRSVGCWSILKRGVGVGVGVGVGGSSSFKSSAAIASRDTAPNIPRSSLVFDAGMVTQLNCLLPPPSQLILFTFFPVPSILHVFVCVHSFSFINQHLPVPYLNSRAI